MRVNEHFEQLEERIRKLEKELAGLKKADAKKAGTAKAAGTKAKKTTAGK